MTSSMLLRLVGGSHISWHQLFYRLAGSAVYLSWHHIWGDAHRQTSSTGGKARRTIKSLYRRHELRDL